MASKISVNGFFPNPHDHSASAQSQSKGLVFGLTAYFIWGIVPLYWPHLQPASPLEILAHRVIWSLVLLGLIVGVQKSFPKVASVLRNPRSLSLLVLAAVLISVNWGIFIWASVTKHLLDSSLGYFITPLLSVALGVVFFKERLRSLQWLAVAIATASVIFLTVTLGTLPWVALSLATSFGIYGYIKKLANVPAIESLFIETLLLAPVALGYLFWLAAHGQGSFGHQGMSHALWLASSGIVTAVPLLFFGAAAIRVPLTTMGMLQYLGPTLQYIIGLYVFHEPMSHIRLTGFILTWIAIGIFTFDALHRRQVTRSGSTHSGSAQS